MVHRHRLVPLSDVVSEKVVFDRDMDLQKGSWSFHVPRIVLQWTSARNSHVSRRYYVFWANEGRTIMIDVCRSLKGRTDSARVRISNPNIRCLICISSSWWNFEIIPRSAEICLLFVDSGLSVSWLVTQQNVIFARSDSPLLVLACLVAQTSCLKLIWLIV